MVIEEIIESYNSLIELLPANLKILPPLFFIGIVITFYSIFIWFFYRFLARRDIIKLNLAEYNEYKHSGIVKGIVTFNYIIKFMIITPIVTLFWFSILSILIILLAKELDVGTIILISAALISAVRITAYFNEDLSKDLAKMFPFTLLGVVILSPGFLEIGTSISRILEVPKFFTNGLYYFLFIFALEVVLRIFYIPVEMIESRKKKHPSAEKKEE